MKITGKPVGGINFRAWNPHDLDKWWELIRKKRDYSETDIEHIQRIRKKYKLDRFYSFT